MHTHSIDSSRQWRESYELNEEYLHGQAELVNMAVDDLDKPNRDIMHAWAWENHYNRRVIKVVLRAKDGIKVFRSNRVSVTPEALLQAQNAMIPLLRRHHVELPI